MACHTHTQQIIRSVPLSYTYVQIQSEIALILNSFARQSTMPKGGVSQTPERASSLGHAPQRSFLPFFCCLLLIRMQRQCSTVLTGRPLDYSSQTMHCTFNPDKTRRKGREQPPFLVFSFSYEEDLGSEWRMAFLSSSVECEHSRPAWLRTPICNTISAQSMHISKAQRRKRGTI